jgi:hypothetical protein
VNGQELTAVANALGGDGALSYQWTRGSTNVGTNSQYTLTAADLYSKIKVTVRRAGYTGEKSAETDTEVFDTETNSVVLYAGSDTMPLASGTIEDCLAALDKRLEDNPGSKSAQYTIRGLEKTRLINPVTLGGNGSAQRASGNAMVFPYLDTLTNPLTIQVNGGTGGATLDLAQPGNMFSFASDMKVDATFENITFRGLYKTDAMPEYFRASADSSRNSGAYAANGNYLASSDRYKSLLNIEGAATVTLKNSNVTGNYGGEANNPEDPGIYYYGGGVSVIHPGKLILDNGGRVAYNSLAPCPSGVGGGGGIGGNGTVELRVGSIVEHNYTTSRGGGIGMYGSNCKMTMSGGTISGNEASEGGGIYINDGSTLTMSGGTISGNKAGSIGGGVYVRGGTFTMAGGAIQDNLGGGGLCVLPVDNGNANFIMSGGTIRNNTGGAIFPASGRDYRAVYFYDAYWAQGVTWVIDLNGDGVKDTTEVTSQLILSGDSNARSPVSIPKDATGTGSGGTAGQTDTISAKNGTWQINLGDAEIYNSFIQTAYGDAKTNMQLVRTQTDNTAIYAGADAEAFLATHSGW